MADPKPTITPKPVGGSLTFATMPVIGRVGLGVLLCSVIGGIYYFALHTPLTEDLDRAHGAHTRLEEERLTAQRRQREYIELREELAGREGLDRANLRVLPEDAEIPAFLADLHRLAEMSGLEMRLVQPRPEEPSEHFVEVPVALRLSGRYHQLARFFYNVSRLERAISMENVVLATPHAVGEDVVMTVEVMATTYRRPSAEELAPPEPVAGGKP